jgi:hypothetical protein
MQAYPATVVTLQVVCPPAPNLNLGIVYTQNQTSHEIRQGTSSDYIIDINEFSVLSPECQSISSYGLTATSGGAVETIEYFAFLCASQPCTQITVSKDLFALPITVGFFIVATDSNGESGQSS